MARAQTRSKRKPTGSRYKRLGRGKTKNELSGYAANTKLSANTKKKVVRTIGGNKKQKVLSTEIMNVTDKKGKSQKTQILNVIENPANPPLVRRNIITKGAIVETKLGKAKVTSRPGQENSLNGMLL